MLECYHLLYGPVFALFCFDTANGIGNLHNLFFKLLYLSLCRNRNTLKLAVGKDLEGKGFDPRKLLAPGYEAIKATVKEKMELFGSVGKAND